MGSRNPPTNLYDPALRATIERAFDDTWTVLQARDPFRDFDADNEFKTELSHKLSALAADGVLMPLSFENGPLRAYQAIGDPASAGAYLRTARPDRNLLRAAAKDEEPDTAAACRAHPHAGWFRALAGVATKRRPVFGRGDDFGP